MPAYYNEIDPYAAQWLRNLIAAGHIADGEVDERSIVDVRADDLRGYTQCHFFAGIGGWSYALRLAGWDDARPVWTGSCPCQPFSAAGKGKAADDERHLWPAWFSLIAECRPPVVFGEQVEAAVGWGWVDAVFSDLEAEGYACGTAVLPACGVGAHHIRQRLWFVANTGGERCGREQVRLQQRRSQFDHAETFWSGGAGELADARHDERPAWPSRREQQSGASISQGAGSNRADGELGHSSSAGGWRDRGTVFEPKGTREGEGSKFRNLTDEPIASSLMGYADSKRKAALRGIPGWASAQRIRSPWASAEWIACRDDKSRPVEPGTFPLAHGIPGRVGRLRAYGNAIVPSVAAEFIMAAS